MEIREIEIGDIHFGERLRRVDPVHVQMLAKSIREQGQRAPVDVREEVDGHYPLIAGAHRVEACRSAGLTRVLAIVHDVDDLTAKLIEVDENLMRHELTALDRAAFLVQRKALYLEKFPQSARGGKRGKGQSELEFALPPAFAKDAAKRLDLSKRWIEMAISFHARLVPEARERLSGTKLADNARVLIEISRLDANEQMPVIWQMLDTVPPARTVAQAVERLFQRSAPKLHPVDAKFRRFVADWSTSGEPLQDQVIGFLRRQGFKITPPKNGG